MRGREYLRIIYGPDYSLPEHLERLRKRGLSTRCSMALRQFAFLGPGYLVEQRHAALGDFGSEAPADQRSESM